MSSPRSRAKADTRGNPVQSNSDSADLRAKFERDVVSMYDVLYRHAYRMSRSHLDAEDLVQEVMMKAYAAFHTFRVDTNVNAWVFRILTNTFINGYRKKRRQPMLWSTDDVTDQGLAKAYAHANPMGMRSAEDQALNLLPDNDILAAMRALPQQFRDVVYYADIEGFGSKEIASIMNTPIGTVLLVCGVADSDSAACLATALAVLEELPFRDRVGHSHEYAGAKSRAQPVHSFTPTLGCRSERTPTKWLVSSMQPEKRECVRGQGPTGHRDERRGDAGLAFGAVLGQSAVGRLTVHGSLLGFVGGVVVVLDAVFGQPGDGQHGGTLDGVLA